MLFSNFIKNLRGKENLSQKELADKLGVSQRTISFYENGGFPSEPRIFQALSEFSNVPVENLMAIAGQMPKEEIFY